MVIVGPAAQRAERQVAEHGPREAGERSRELAAGAGGEQHQRLLRVHHGVLLGQRGHGAGGELLTRAGLSREARIEHHDDPRVRPRGQPVEQLLPRQAAGVQRAHHVLRIGTDQHAIGAVLRRRAVADEEDPEGAAGLHLLRQLVQRVLNAFEGGVGVLQPGDLRGGHAAGGGEVLVPGGGVLFRAGHVGEERVVADGEEQRGVILTAALFRERGVDGRPLGEGRDREQDEEANELTHGGASLPHFIGGGGGPRDPGEPKKRLTSSSTAQASSPPNRAVSL